MKNKCLNLTAALGTLLALGAVNTAQAADDHSNQEKCYGVAKAGENGCAAKGHSCQGQSKANKDPSDWKYVAKGSCATMGGSATDKAAAPM